MALTRHWRRGAGIARRASDAALAFDTFASRASQTTVLQVFQPWRPQLRSFVATPVVNASRDQDPPADDEAEPKAEETEKAEAEAEETTEDTSASSSEAEKAAQPSRLGFMWEVLKEAVGLGASTGVPGADGTDAADFPWVEFVGSDKQVRYRHKVTGEVVSEAPEGFAKYGRAAEVDTETLALAVVQQPEQSRWDRYRAMLSDTPLMRALDAALQGVSDSTPVKAARDAQEDLRETWETSQNPMVHRVASAYDAVFAETEQARAVARIQELDPRFDGGGVFLDECRNVIIPRLVSALLRGDRVELDGWCTDECMARVNAVLRARESEGLTVDSTVLSTSQVTLAGAKMPETGPPVVLVTGMVQQLHCLRNKDGEVVEGSEDEIRAVMYALGLMRLYLPKKGGLVWQVAELSYTGGQLYL